MVHRVTSAGPAIVAEFEEFCLSCAGKEERLPSRPETVASGSYYKSKRRLFYSAPGSLLWLR
jgi:hypothetical protein